ncbi:ABC transporter permease [Insolitispirillum peregrinum]|uniref:Transport permease protein n=1 Tax=Insolitispirillum peregrinum TaxID=80876 RepID=A0A1N7P3C9_9PROT|nr:ABC transporter permease [Insolitispirillum peregrinum]SIT05046.1 ABC-2 type transport system permease protein [Insolitispirillum peregrinum]
MDRSPTAPAPQPIGLMPPRQMGAVNWRGLWELYLKEVRRFVKVWLQTIAAPMVTSLLFLAIFALSLGDAVHTAGGVSFLEFLAPGLIMMTMVQNAFANTSSSVIISKVQGNIVDVLMPPISPGELTVAYALGGVTRGVVVGIAVALGMIFFVPLHAAHPLYILFHAIGASLMLSVLGVLAGVWSEKFDHMAAFTNFIVTPLSFLSGTFYSLDRLPPDFQAFAHFNPFFYMIDGFRYGFIAHPDALPLTGLAVVGITDVVLLVACWLLVRSGYKLKN